MNSRAIAAKIICEVIADKRSLTKVLKDNLAEKINKNEQAFIQELSYGTLRWYNQLLEISNHLLNTPLKSKNQDLLCLLITGLYQLLFSHKPDYAVVSETVTASKILKKNWAKGLLNKLLRRFIAEKDKILETINQEPTAHYSHPLWLLQKIQKDWPNDWQDIIKANNSRPTLTLRVNAQKTNREEYFTILNENNITAKKIPGLTHAIQLNHPIPVTRIPGFKEGFCSIQDGSGQKVIELLDIHEKHNVLDACAAPGSKTCHILETVPNLSHLVAIDKDANRLTKIKENIERLELPHDKLHFVLADASHTKQWWDGIPYDRILLDAPCTASGTISRHPDIKILREPEDIETLAQQQIHLLNSLWPILKKQGRLLYTTCSIFPEENEQIIQQFLRIHKDAKIIPLNIEWGVALNYGRQQLPHYQGMDGFYYALIEKK